MANENGLWPAFPCQPRDAQNAPIAEYAPGLTKRELLAAMAMQGMLASDDTSSTTYIAQEAVKLADALLSALERGTP